MYFEDSIITHPEEVYTEDGYIRISKYRMMANDFCAQSYKLSILDGIQVDQSIEMLQGSRFHKGAHRWFDLINLDVLKDCKTYDDAQRHFANTAIDMNINPPVSLWLWNFAKQEAKRYWTFCREQDQPLDYFMPMIREARYETKPMMLKNKTFVFNGIIDRADLLPSGKLLLIDYKRRIGNLTRFRKEMAFYYILFNNAMYNPLALLHGASHVGGYSCLDDNWVTMELKTATFSALNKSVMRFVNNTEKNEFEPNVTDWCVNCSVAHACEAWR